MFVVNTKILILSMATGFIITACARFHEVLRDKEKELLWFKMHAYKFVFTRVATKMLYRH